MNKHKYTRHKGRYLFLKTLIFTILCFVLIAAGYLAAAAVTSLITAF